jgi:hypothetical protein
MKTVVAFVGHKINERFVRNTEALPYNLAIDKPGILHHDPPLASLPPVACQNKYIQHELQ